MSLIFLQKTIGDALLVGCKSCGWVDASRCQSPQSINVCSKRTWRNETPYPLLAETLRFRTAGWVDDALSPAALLQLICPSSWSGGINSREITTNWYVNFDIPTQAIAYILTWITMRGTFQNVNNTKRPRITMSNPCIEYGESVPIYISGWTRLTFRPTDSVGRLFILLGLAAAPSYPFFTVSTRSGGAPLDGSLGSCSLSAQKDAQAGSTNAF